MCVKCKYFNTLMGKCFGFSTNLLTEIVRNFIYVKAEAQHPRLICRKIKEKSKKAVARSNELKPYIIKPPISMELTFKNTYEAEAFSYLPWIKRLSGKTILVETESKVDMNRFLTALFSIDNR